MSKERDELASEQAGRFETEIAALHDGHREVFRRNCREFFAHAKQISQLFKESRALLRGDRQRLWEQFSTLCDSVRQEQDRERESRVNNSRVKKEMIEPDIREAYYWAEGSNTISDLQAAERSSAKVTEKMKDGWDGFTGTTDFFESIGGNDGRLTREDGDYLWEKWREAKAAVRERREWLQELHFNHMRGIAEECLSLAHSNSRVAKERVKAANAEMKQKPMNSTQYADIHRMLDEAWELASQTASERHHEWRERMESHIQRWEELTEKNEGVVSRLEEQIAECEEMEANARSDDFAGTVRGWIDEKMEKIRDIRHTNEELEERIESVKGKLSK
jgi:hypothetical protein